MPDFEYFAYSSHVFKVNSTIADDTEGNLTFCNCPFACIAYILYIYKNDDYEFHF